MLPSILRARHVRANEDKGLTRRQLLVRGAFAAGAVTLVGAVLRFASFLRHDPAPGLDVLSAREVDILSAVLLTMFPGGGGMPPANVDALIPQIDGQLAGSDPDARLLSRTMLHVIEEQAVLFSGAHFTKLEPAQQTRELEAWERTTVYPKRMAYRSLKLLCGMAYTEQPETREAMGWYLGCSPSHLRGHSGA